MKKGSEYSLEFFFFVTYGKEKKTGKKTVTIIIFLHSFS